MTEVLTAWVAVVVAAGAGLAAIRVLRGALRDVHTTTHDLSHRLDAVNTSLGKARSAPAGRRASPRRPDAG